MAEIVILAFDDITLLGIFGLLVFRRERGLEARRNAAQRDAAFRSLGAGHRRHDTRKIEIDRVGEDGIWRRRGAEQALRLGVFLDQRNARRRARRGFKIIQRLIVDREETAGRAIFRRHIGDRRTVGEREMFEAGTVEFDEFADDAELAQHLRHGQHEIGRGYALFEFAGQFEADNFRQQHGEWLAEHAGFRLDAADAPAEHRESVDHRRMRIGADERIGIGDFDRHFLAAAGLIFFLPRPDGLREIFKIDLMADAGAGRHDAEIVERALTPFQEAVALAVAVIFEIDIGLEGFVAAEGIDDHRMVDDQIDGHEWVDLLWVAAELQHGIAHRREIDDGWYAGEILHQNARRPESDFLLDLALVDEPFGDGLDRFFGNRAAILETQQIFEQDFHRKRQRGNAGQTILLRRLERIIMIGLGTDVEDFAALKRIERSHRLRGP